MMCGRFALAAPASRIQEVFGLPAVPALLPRFNVAPGTQVAGILKDIYGPTLEWFRWGLIPSWAKDAKIGYRALNARSETARSKPMFRSAFKQRRLLIPMDGFYEWTRVGTTKKQPWHIGLPNGEPFAVAGLWETWTAPDGEVVKSITLMTTAPNAILAPIHSRMPVILPESTWEAWLAKDTDLDAIEHLLVPYEGELHPYQVSTTVNKVANTGPECKEPLNDEANT
jgi:putative SOS response-associated peptidase YedK